MRGTVSRYAALAPASSLVWARRIAVAVIGATLLLIGLILLVVPGPGLLVLALGLAVLAAEFTWARRWLRRLRSKAGELAGAAGGARSRR